MRTARIGLRRSLPADLPGTGAGLWWAARKETHELKVRDGFLMVVLVWSVLPVFAGMPLMFQLHASFTDAYFEAMSGLTTTGATVLANLDKLPPSINLWRGMLVWLGGMGLIVLAVAILPLLGIGGRQMFKAETPGPMKDSQLTPRMTQTAKGLWGVYAVVTVLCILSLHWAGMSWFDAVMHSFTTMGLGGFSSHDASFGHWNSPLIEAVTVVFMLLAGMNFATMFLAVLRSQPSSPTCAIRRRAGSSASRSAACSASRSTSWAMGLSGLRSRPCAMRPSTWCRSPPPPASPASITTCGPSLPRLWMLFLCSFATSAGSTGGGIKMIRAIILYKQVYRELMRSMHPNVVWPVRIGGDPVPQNILFAVLAFAFVYMCSIATLTLLMSFSGLDIITAFSAVVASINNTGPGLNQVGPATTYEVLTDFQTWVCSFAMLLGRLEIFTLLVVLTPAFWRR
jgi:trk system potassium uptake protein TrkH